MRIALGIEYDGTAYHGWQFQGHDPLTVQENVEKALQLIATHPVRVSCAGRTDSGVHAMQQVVHFDTASERPESAWVLGGSRYLPRDISILWARRVPDTFHARFSAERRAYRYRIYNHPIRPAVCARYCTWYRRPLDLKKMQDAVVPLLGRHDFTSFRASGCQAKSPFRTLHDLRLTQQGRIIDVEIEADGFLYHMVRNLIGVLLAIGAGLQPVSWMQAVLEKRDRRLGGITAPATGLHFLKATYPLIYQLPIDDFVWRPGF